ncbi:dienelactone hydrolase [Amycolatopsis lexingtonensis]|uniref:Dienelactone hydrolase n=1 Tax=Amycolatopsis lexingtonensis TaxID=218822 RepID=A0ABR9IB21_9PSEU|nr:alpha/beta hydrolase [Amycolatopsis lexingtonensis]MBE1500383.1 dienelactone hydrolase [Amycolatopsis lexingtonensis]
MRRGALLLAGVILAITAPPASAADGSDVTFTNGGVTLHGTVVAPPGGTKLPGLVMVHGSGAHSREDYRDQAEAFARQGIATLIYDKRTEGYSQFSRSYSTLADDALAAVEALRKRPDVDPARVGVWGLSEGGWVAPLAASRSADVAFVVTLGANGVEPSRQQAWAIENQLRRLGMDGSMVRMASSTMMRQLVGGGVFPEAHYDPVPVLKSLRQPVLGLWGAKDVLTPPGEAVRIFQASLAKYTLRVFPDAQHQLRRTTDGFDKLPGYAPGYLELVGTWINHPPTASSADAPPAQDRPSVQITPLSWYEPTWLQLAVLVLLLVAFAWYPLLRRGPAAKSARWLSATGLLAVLGFLAFDVLIQVTMGRGLGPVVAGRPLPWLALQLLSLGVVAAAIGTAVAWWRHRSPRLGVPLAGGVVFVPWAVYWGLLGI